MQNKPFRPSMYYAVEIKKLKSNSKKYHDLLKQFLTYFKVNKCNEQSKHNQELCFSYHDRNDRRRNPFYNHEFLYSIYALCDCEEPNCPGYHNQYERLYHPLLYKTVQCLNQCNCQLGFYCPYTHGEDLLHFQYGEFFRFDIRTFKTEKCFKKNNHERKTCLYYHNDKDKRRPSNIQYSHFFCNKQKCHDPNCGASHNKLEQLYHPNRYKTKFCQFYPNKIDQCDYKSFCSFAHTQNEIIQNIDLIHLQEKTAEFYMYKYKTVWCPFTQNHQRDKCPYAHNIQDYRRNPKEYHYEPIRCQFWNFSDEIKSIELAGCQMQMECKKCHGWMQQRYHPSKYNNQKRSKSLKKQEIIEGAQLIFNKKLTDLNIPNDYKAKGKGNTNPQILKTNYTKGTPFFKNDKCSEYSAKTKAKSNNIQSQKSMDGSSNKDAVKINDLKMVPLNSSKILFSYPAQEDQEMINWQSEHCRLQTQQVKDQNSSRSKSAQKSEQYQATYTLSNSIKSALEDDDILKKLRKHKLNQIQITNMDQTKIDKLSFLTAEQRNRLAMKLQIYNIKQTNTVSYSKELTRYFITKKKEGILQKMQQKKVKQAKILKLVPKQINQLSFLEAEEKTVLPKLLKEYLNEKQFKQLNKRIEEETKMK